LPPGLLISIRPTVFPFKPRRRAGGIDARAGVSFIGFTNLVGICAPLNHTYIGATSLFLLPQRIFWTFSQIGYVTISLPRGPAAQLPITAENFPAVPPTTTSRMDVGAANSRKHRPPPIRTS